jgi:hypothetical protein
MIKKKKVYISAPMTGHPDLNRPAFMAAEARLKKKYIVLNPARIKIVKGKPYRYYLQKAVKLMMEADCICPLQGWERSKGAFAERVLADALGLEVIIL